MNEHLAWVRWWAWPWQAAHPDWLRATPVNIPSALWRSHPAQANLALGIAPCLPLEPSVTQLRLALASSAQLDLMLALLGNTCRPLFDGGLSEEQHLWCMRLSKALHHDALLAVAEDPLHLLQVWVSPVIWQRLRLRFSRQRVLDLESHPTPTNDAHNRLDTLWQAVIWRVTTPQGEAPSPHSTGRGPTDVLPAQN